MTDADVNAAARRELAEQPVCAECGGTEGKIQHADIAWPFLEPPRHYALWLHPECEAVCIERLETEMKEQQK